MAESLDLERFLVTQEGLGEAVYYNIQIGARPFKGMVKKYHVLGILDAMKVVFASKKVFYPLIRYDIKEKSLLPSIHKMMDLTKGIRQLEVSEILGTFPEVVPFTYDEDRSGYLAFYVPDSGRNIVDFFSEYPRLHIPNSNGVVPIEYYSSAGVYETVKSIATDVHDTVGVTSASIRKHFAKICEQYPIPILTTKINLVGIVKAWSGAKSILDLSSGLGDLAIACGYHGLNYTGIDPNLKLKSTYGRICKFMSKYKKDANLNFLYVPAEDFKGKKHYDIVYFDPPTFEDPVYAEHPSQVSRRYKTKEEYMEKFLMKCFKTIEESQGPNAYLIVKSSISDLSYNRIYRNLQSYGYDIIGDICYIVEGGEKEAFHIHMKIK